MPALSFLLVALAVLTVVAALPSPSPSTGQSFLDQYDDLGNTLTGNNPLISDGGVTYNAFLLGTRNNISALQPGVNSQSPPNRAIYGGITDLSPASIATDQVCVQLQSMYIGCATSLAQATATLPVECTITLMGFDKGEKSTGNQTFTFTPTGLTTSNMMKVDVTEVGKSKVVGFSTSNQAVTVTLIDNLAYTQWNDKEYCGPGEW